VSTSSQNIISILPQTKKAC